MESNYILRPTENAAVLEVGKTDELDLRAGICAIRLPCKVTVFGVFFKKTCPQLQSVSLVQFITLLVYIKMNAILNTSVCVCDTDLQLT